MAQQQQLFWLELSTNKGSRKYNQALIQLTSNEESTKLWITLSNILRKIQLRFEANNLFLTSLLFRQMETETLETYWLTCTRK